MFTIKSKWIKTWENYTFKLVIDYNNLPLDKEIKFHNEAHRKNYEGVIKNRSEQKQKLDSKTMIEQMRKNSKD